MAILGLSVWAYGTSFAGVFVHDDMPAIVTNPHIKQLWPLSEAIRAPEDSSVAGRPIASLTLALNYALAPPGVRDVMAPGELRDSRGDAFYRNVWGYHFVNLSIHALAALLLFAVIRRSLRASPTAGAYGHIAERAAACVAIVWFVHPLHTESVTFIVQRTEALAGLLILLTLYCAIRATESAARQWSWAAGAVAACVTGVGAKEVVGVAPILVAAWILVFRRPGESTRRFIGTLLAALAATWVPLVLLIGSGVRSRSVGFHLPGWTWWSYLQTQAGVVAHYLKLSLAPFPLVFIYDWPPAESFRQIAPQSLLLGVLVALTLFGITRRHPAASLGVVFFGILAPTSSVLPIATEVAAEHRMYLPVAAVIVVVALCGYAAGRRAIGAGLSARLVTSLGWFTIVAVVVACTMLTRARNVDYWSEEALMRDTVQKRPFAISPRLKYGAILFSQRRYAEAADQLRVAITLPRSPGSDSSRLALAHMYLGASLSAQDSVTEGITHLRRAAALDSSLFEAYGFLGEANLALGHPEAAIDAFEQAIQRMPNLPPLLNRVAWIYATSRDDRMRNGSRAVELAERAVGLAGPEPQLLQTLAAAYAESQRFGDAVNASGRALAEALARGDRQSAAIIKSQTALYERGEKLRVNDR